MIWLSIRVKGRTWSNLIDGYANIIKTLLKDYPNLTIVFDGFSIPPNSRKFGTSNYTDLIQAEHDVVNEIVRKVNVKFNFCNIIGQSLDVSFFWTQLVDLYITHHGTIQHKIGWFTTELGIIHTNKLITMKPEKSHQGSFDRKDARIPLYLQPHLITDIDEMVKTRSGQLKNGENRNYNFDWKEIIKLINSNFKF